MTPARSPHRSPFHRLSSAVLALGIAAGCGGEGDRQADVMVDPYSTNPLAAVVNVRGFQAAEVESVQVVVHGLDGAPDLLRTYQPGGSGYDQAWGTPDIAFPADGVHVPVVGLYADRMNQVTVAVRARDGRTATVTLPIETHLSDPADVLGAWIPDIQVNTATPERMEPGWTVIELDLSDAGRSWARPLAFDETGAIRWTLRLDFLGDYALPLFRSATGNFLTGRFGQLVEITELGRIVRTFGLPGYLAHHEILEIPSGAHAGNLLVSVDQIGAETIEDRVVEVDRTSGSIVQVWDLGRTFDPARTALIDSPLDWLHNNGLAYSVDDDCLIVSARHQGVAKMDRSGGLIWLLAPHRGWNAPQADRLLTAVSAAGTAYGEGVQDGGESAGAAEFDWPWGQHAPSLLPDGDLLLFDNGWNRRFDPASPQYSRAVIYRVDEERLTVRQMWEYGADRGSAYWASFVSSASFLPATGNVLVQPGATQLFTPAASAITTEVTPEGEVVFDATIRFASSTAARAGSGVDYSYRAHRFQF